MLRAHAEREKISGADWSHVPSLSEGCGAIWQAWTGECGGAGRAIVRANVEGAMLMSRRAMAYMELPARLATCRQPQDFAAVQMSFWKNCLAQYQESSAKIAECLGPFQMLTGVEESLSDPGDVNVGAMKVRPVRDYVTFPEPQAAEKSAKGAAGSSKTAHAA